jgi:hypothetical protein
MILKSLISFNMAFLWTWKVIFSSKFHGSALQFPAEVDWYFLEETHFGAILGPYPDPPFLDLH